jgi:hypothetical protein
VQGPNEKLVERSTIGDPTFSVRSGVEIVEYLAVAGGLFWVVRALASFLQEYAGNMRVCAFETRTLYSLPRKQRSHCEPAVL